MEEKQPLPIFKIIIGGVVYAILWGFFLFIKWIAGVYWAVALFSPIIFFSLPGIFRFLWFFWDVFNDELEDQTEERMEYIPAMPVKVLLLMLGVLKWIYLKITSFLVDVKGGEYGAKAVLGFVLERVIHIFVDEPLIPAYISYMSFCFFILFGVIIPAYAGYIDNEKMSEHTRRVTISLNKAFLDSSIIGTGFALVCYKFFWQQTEVYFQKFSFIVPILEALNEYMKTGWFYALLFLIIILFVISKTVKK